MKKIKNKIHVLTAMIFTEKIRRGIKDIIRIAIHRKYIGISVRTSLVHRRFLSFLTLLFFFIFVDWSNAKDPPKGMVRIPAGYFLFGKKKKKFTWKNFTSTEQRCP